MANRSSQLFDLRAPSSTDVPVLLLNQPIILLADRRVPSNNPRSLCVSHLDPVSSAVLSGVHLSVHPVLRTTTSSSGLVPFLKEKPWGRGCCSPNLVSREESKNEFWFPRPTVSCEQTVHEVFSQSINFNALPVHTPNYEPPSSLYCKRVPKNSIFFWILTFKPQERSASNFWV